MAVLLLNISLNELLHQLSTWVWNPVLVAICLLCGLLFSCLTRFVQVRHIGEMVRLLFAKNNQGNGVSSFQAFAMALSGRVGTGNIVGVATAIAFGGPGAIVWMWIVAFLGAGTAFAESTLAQIYKEEHGGQFRGGPTYYIEKGLNVKWLAVIFAIVAVISFGFFLPPIQSNGITTAFVNCFHLNKFVVGVGLTILLALVVCGGVKRIAVVAEYVTPFMAIVYMLISIVVLCLNATAIPHIFKELISSAFGIHSLFGGMVGSAITWGVKRGLYSNESGQGSGATVAGAAAVSHPVKQGLVQSFSVYVDTLLVCSATAVMILATKCYNVIDSNTGQLVYASAKELGEPGISYTFNAIASVFGFGIANVFVPIALAFFAFTTTMAYYYYAETNIVYLFKNGKCEKVSIWVLRIAILLATFSGAVRTASSAWDLGDVGVGCLLWINIIVILLLAPKVIRTLKSYEKQQKEGKDPVFNPKELNIKNANFWEQKNAEEQIHKD